MNGGIRERLESPTTKVCALTCSDQSCSFLNVFWCLSGSVRLEGPGAAAGTLLEFEVLVSDVRGKFSFLLFVFPVIIIAFCFTSVTTVFLQGPAAGNSGSLCCVCGVMEAVGERDEMVLLQGSATLLTVGAWFALFLVLGGGGEEEEEEEAAEGQARDPVLPDRRRSSCTLGIGWSSTLTCLRGLRLGNAVGGQASAPSPPAPPTPNVQGPGGPGTESGVLVGGGGEGTIGEERKEGNRGETGWRRGRIEG